MLRTVIGLGLANSASFALGAHVRLLLILLGRLLRGSLRMGRADVPLVEVLYNLLFLVGGLSLQVVLVILLVSLLVVVPRIVLDSIVAWVRVMHHLARVVPFVV